MIRRFVPILKLSLVLCLFAPLATAQSKQFIPQKAKAPVWLGVSLAKKSDGEPGVRVRKVLKGSPAPESGVVEGDRIIEINGHKTRSFADVKLIMRGHRDGDIIPVKVKRGAKTKTLSFTLRPKPATTTIVKRQLMGLPAPDVPLQILDAGQVSLSEYKGKPTIIDFWATWCGPCKRADKELAGLKSKHGEKIHVIQISSEKVSTILKHVQKKPKAGVVLQDPGGYANDQFFVSTLPQVILLDKDHNVSAVIFNSNAEWDLFHAKVQKLVGGT